MMGKAVLGNMKAAKTIVNKSDWDSKAENTAPENGETIKTLMQDVTSLWDEEEEDDEAEKEVVRNSNHFKAHENILVFSDIEGGTRYADRENIVGISEYIHSLKPEDKPNIIVMIGGLFPDIPKQGSISSLNKIKVLSSGVDGIEDAAAIMKPHILRLLGELPRTTKIIYAFGPNDWNNITTNENKVKDEYLFYINSIKNRIDGVKEELIGVKATIQLAEISAAKLKEQLKADPKNLNLLKEKINVRSKIRVKSMEHADIIDELKPLEELYAKALIRTKAKTIKLLLDGELAKREEVQEQLETLDKSETEEYLKLSKRAKNIANNMSRLAKRYKEALERETEAKENTRFKQALIYTHNALPDPEAAMLIERYVRAYYRKVIDSTFGFRRSITVQAENEGGVYADNQDKNGDGNVYSNFAVYTTKLGSPELGYSNLNVAIMGSKGRYAQRSNDNIIERLYVKKLNGLLEEHDIESTPISVVITGHNKNSLFKLDSLLNGGPIAAELASGPFWSIHDAAKLAEENLKTDVTKAAQDGLTSSGAHLLRVESNRVEHTNITSDLLHVYAEMQYERERNNIGSVLKELKTTKSAPKNGKMLGSKEELERSILSSKLPSEFKKEDLAQPFVDKKFIRSLVGQGSAEVNKDIKNIKFGVISDVHVGNYADLGLLEKIKEELISRKLDILVLAGDNIEGNYNNYKNVPREVSKIDYHGRVEDELRKQGYGNKFIEDFMLELIKRDEKKVIQNIDEQAKVFSHAIEDLVYDVLSRGGAVVITSGNHYNKTTGGWMYDEATRLGGIVESYIIGRIGGNNEHAKKLLENLKIIPGGEYGGDVINIDYAGKKDFMRMRIEHEGGMLPSTSAKIAERSRDDEKTKIIVKGHIHISEDINADGKFIITAPTMQDSETNPYLNRINIAVDDDLKGALYAEIIATNEGVKAVKTVPLTKLEFYDSFYLLRKEIADRLMAAEINTAKAGKARNLNTA